MGTERPGRSNARATGPDGGQGPSSWGGEEGVRDGGGTVGMDSIQAPQGTLRVSPRRNRGKGQGAGFPMPHAPDECFLWVTAPRKSSELPSV